MIYQLVAAFLYRDDEERLRETQHAVLYETDPDDAVTAAWKWCLNRQTDCPEGFGPLGALKVYSYRIARPAPNGYIGTGAGLDFYYEWKFDHFDPPLLPEIRTPYRFTA